MVQAFVHADQCHHLLKRLAPEEANGGGLHLPFLGVPHQVPAFPALGDTPGGLVIRLAPVTPPVAAGVAAVWAGEP